MSNKEKQIEEMRKDLCRIASYSFCHETSCYSCPTKQFTEDIYNAGYRKDSEVVSNVIDEFIEKSL